MYFDKSILIVDDSPIVRSLLSKMLFNEGFQNIDVAENGRQTLVVFSQKKIDLVLLDYNMPEMT